MNSVIGFLRKRGLGVSSKSVDVSRVSSANMPSTRRKTAALQSSCALTDRRRSLDCYRRLASIYDLHTRRIEPIQHAAIHALGVVDGEHVLDVACGTGKCLPNLAAAVGKFGKVIGVEQSPEMAQLARRRCDGKANVRVIETAVEQLETDIAFDAVLMSFTQDVLQTPAAVARVISCCRPGTRIAVAGLRFLPWLWGAPINVYNAWRARHYLTTYRGMRAPWKALAEACPDISIRQTWFAGSCYLAIGQVTAPLPKAGAFGD